MGTTIWEALADTFVSYRQNEWEVVETDGKNTTVRLKAKPDDTVFITKNSSGVYVVILEK